MYYNRKISDKLSKLIENNGKLRWLFDYVKNHNELDFLIGKSKKKEWVSIYRGITRIISINLTANKQIIKVNGAKTYQEIMPNLYGKKSITANFKIDIELLIKQIESNPGFDRYYKNKKEGYYQNILSRKYGINGNPNDDFVIIDKEVVIGYANTNEKQEKFSVGIQKKYKELQKEISSLNSKLYGVDLDKKAIGNELDFLALDKEGNILLIEYKHGTNTSGIYLSPLQIGVYYDIFNGFLRSDLEKSVFEMLAQKQEIGLINPKWVKPLKIKDIIPVLVVSEYNYNSSAKEKYDQILSFMRKKQGQAFLKNIRTYNFTEKNGLAKW